MELRRGVKRWVEADNRYRCAHGVDALAIQFYRGKNGALARDRRTMLASRFGS